MKLLPGKQTIGQKQISPALKLEKIVGNELVHAGSHARPQAVDRGIPSQGGSTE